MRPERVALLGVSGEWDVPELEETTGFRRKAAVPDDALLKQGDGRLSLDVTNRLAHTSDPIGQGGAYRGLRVLVTGHLALERTGISDG